MTYEDDNGTAQIEFRKGLLPFWVWLVATLVFAPASGIAMSLVDSGPLKLVLMVGGFVGLAAIAWLVLRWEGVTINQVGAGR